MNAYSNPNGYIMLGLYIMSDVANFDPENPLLPVSGFWRTNGVTSFSFKGAGSRRDHRPRLLQSWRRTCSPDTTLRMCYENYLETGTPCGPEDLHGIFVQAVEALGASYPQSVSQPSGPGLALFERAHNMYRTLDLAWIADVGDGTRSLSEKGSIPGIRLLTKEQRLRSGPHF